MDIFIKFTISLKGGKDISIHALRAPPLSSTTMVSSCLDGSSGDFERLRLGLGPGDDEGVGGFEPPAVGVGLRELEGLRVFRSVPVRGDGDPVAFPLALGSHPHNRAVAAASPKTFSSLFRSNAARCLP